MLGQVVGSILCVAVALLLGSVILQERESLPMWVVVLAGASALMMLATAVRLVFEAKRRYQIVQGPRTKIVIAPAHPRAAKDRREGRELPSDD
jgi:hypothetical protein